jgi:hypothetical protein
MMGAQNAVETKEMWTSDELCCTNNCANAKAASTHPLTAGRCPNGFGMSSEFNFSTFIPRDDMLLCNTTDSSLSLPTIARTYDMIDRSMTISSSRHICDSMFIMAPDN